MASIDFINNTYYFSITRVNRNSPGILLYNVCLNDITYLISKSIAKNEFTQLDSHPKLNTAIFYELNQVLLEVEPLIHRRVSIELINQQIFRILSKMRSESIKLSGSNLK